MKLRMILAAGLVGCAAAWGADLRIGVIGCDTSHVPAFTGLLAHKYDFGVLGRLTRLMRQRRGILG